MTGTGVTVIIETPNTREGDRVFKDVHEVTTGSDGEIVVRREQDGEIIAEQFDFEHHICDVLVDGRAMKSSWGSD